jgi:molybdate transport system substrate-binding protein
VRHRRAFHRVLVGALAVTLALAGCGGGEDRRSRGPAQASPAPVTVFAAASLTEAFTEIGRQLESTSGTRVTFSFGASSSLARQVANGAPADVLATADEPTMRRAGDRVAQPVTVFAHNRLAMAVRRGNPKAIRSLADLARGGVVLVVCAPEVPCGRFGDEALARAGVDIEPRSLEPDVKGVVAKVSLGEADAGIVYVTDVRTAAGQLEEVTIPPEHNVVARYPIAPLRDSAHPESAKAFVDAVVSPSGRAVLERAGFGAP